MRLSVLGSGSKGNATLVRVGRTTLLIDAGFSGRDLARRLKAVGVRPHEVDALLITHDHGDHTRGMGVMARRFGMPIYVTDGTRRACAKLLRGDETCVAYRAGHPFPIGDVLVEPFATVHDAADPVAVAVSDPSESLRLGVATDLGRPNAQIRHALTDSDFLILEANHDETLLHGGPYPWRVKSRIASSHGHLSNHAAARLALDLLHPGLLGILLAHLSYECNRAHLAKAVVEGALRRAGYRGFVDVATQDDPTELIDLRALRDRAGPEQIELF